MFKSHFGFLKDIDTVSQNHPVKGLPDPVSMQPVDYNVKNYFDLAVSSYQGLDELILEQLCPSITDRSVLAPTQYEKLLLKATESLFRINQQSGDSNCAYCGEMLKYEALHVESIHLKKRY